MIRPSDLAPTYQIAHSNQNNIFIIDYFAPYYFKNLQGRLGNNRKGSCAYVAVDMFFFYHDLFWDDNFLPQKFNGENVFVDETILNTINSLCSKNEAYIEVNPNNLSDRNYLKLVNDNADKIVHFDLSSRSIK